MRRLQANLRKKYAKERRLATVATYKAMRAKYKKVPPPPSLPATAAAFARSCLPSPSSLLDAAASPPSHPRWFILAKAFDAGVAIPHPSSPRPSHMPPLVRREPPPHAPPPLSSA